MQSHDIGASMGLGSNVSICGKSCPVCTTPPPGPHPGSGANHEREVSRVTPMFKR